MTPMTYGGPDPYPYPAQSPTAYSGYWPYYTGFTNQRSLPETRLLWAVVALGVATYVVGYGPMPAPGGMDWAVRFATLAAIVAALGLLPRQSAHTKAMVPLAVMGFLDALWRLITVSGGQESTWAAIVIVVVNALQALTAIGALLAQIRLFSSDRQSTAYNPYAYYAQAAQQYYAAGNQQPQQQAGQAMGTARAHAAAPAQAQRSAAERDALYEEYVSVDQPGPNRFASSPRPGGPAQTARPAPGSGLPDTGPAETTRPGYGPPPESPTQSPSS